MLYFNADLLVFFHQLPPEYVLSCTFFVTFLGLFLSTRFFGKSGLYVFGCLAFIVGNIQVLKGVQLSLWQGPVALGTIVFSSTFVVSDVLTQVYGKQAAFKGVALSFGASLLFTLLMLLTVSVRPLGVPLDHPDAHFDIAHRAMEILFLPAPRLLVASLIAFAISQILDIVFFDKLKRLKWGSIATRSATSTALAFLVDNTVFSVLAWRFLAETPVPWESLVWTYILGTYVLRLLVTVLFLPLVSLLCRQLSEAPHA